MIDQNSSAVIEAITYWK